MGRATFLVSLTPVHTRPAPACSPCCVWCGGWVGLPQQPCSTRSSPSWPGSDNKCICCSLKKSSNFVTLIPLFHVCGGPGGFWSACLHVENLLFSGWRTVKVNRPRVWGRWLEMTSPSPLCLNYIALAGVSGVAQCFQLKQGACLARRAWRPGCRPGASTESVRVVPASAGWAWSDLPGSSRTSLLHQSLTSSPRQVPAASPAVSGSCSCGGSAERSWLCFVTRGRSAVSSVRRGVGWERRWQRPNVGVELKNV